MMKKMLLGVAAFALVGLTACGAACADCAELEDGEVCTSCTVDDAADKAKDKVDDAKDALNDALGDDK